MKFGEKIAAFARAHVGCSAHHNPDLYLEAVAPPADRTGPHVAYFISPHPPSTCALFASRCLADGGGLDDKEINEDYALEVGSAVANVQIVAQRRNALEHTTCPTVPFAEGDIVIIDGPPYGVHVVVITEDVTVQPDGSWTGKTAQGGQADGGVQAFDSSWHVRGGKMYAGTGQRNVIMVARAAKFGIDDNVVAQPEISGPEADGGTATGRADYPEDAPT